MATLKANELLAQELNLDDPQDFEDAKRGFIARPEGKIMCLEEICPEPIQKFLTDQHMLGVIQTYEEYKDAIDVFF